MEPLTKEEVAKLLKGDVTKPLTEEEIERLPSIKRLRRGKERIPRAVLYAARQLPVTEDHIRWAQRVC